jgi:hypothetical protein
MRPAREPGLPRGGWRPGSSHPPCLPQAGTWSNTAGTRTSSRCKAAWTLPFSSSGMLSTYAASMAACCAAASAASAAAAASAASAWRCRAREKKSRIKA